MWTPYYSLILCNTPMYIPIQSTSLLPVPFSMFHQVSTIQKNHNISQDEILLEAYEQNPMIQPLKLKIKQQHQLNQELPFNSQEQLLKNIKILIKKIDQQSPNIQEEAIQEFSLVQTLGKPFFINLINRFKKLSKTKQQLIKYCMRKALKFVNEKLKETDYKLQQGDILKDFLKVIHNSQNQKIPFKKNSNFKTMNAQFLSELFKSKKFIQLYNQFLNVFPKICQDDNQKKAQNLSKIVITYATNNLRDMKKFNNFKRIPWTKPILSKCYQIAKDLQKYSTQSGKRVLSNTDK